MKRALSLFIAVVLVLSSSAIVFGQALDYESSWAKNEINYMKEKGILSGYPDGTFRPNNNMKKTEFFKVINGLMGYTKKAEISFEDIKDTDWFYEEVQKGIGAKYIGQTNLLKANDYITREEVARIISLIFEIQKDEEAEKEFSDYSTISKDIKGVFGGLKKLGYISGYPDGTVRPKGQITRAEVVKMLHSITGEIVNVAGTVSKNIKTNLVVNIADVVLKDMTIEGNLYLTEGIGDGDITLDNVTVKGELSIRGGGANSVVIKNSKINTVIVDREQGLVRVVFENTTVEGLKTISEVTLELKKGTEIKVVELDGKVEVAVEEGATIITLEVVSNEIVVEAKGTIRSIKTTAEIKVNGTTVKANTEVKVEAGKASEVKTPTPPVIFVGPVTPQPTSNAVTISKIKVAGVDAIVYTEDATKYRVTVSHDTVLAEGSLTLTLAAGATKTVSLKDNVYIVVVTAEDGTTKRTYTINVIVKPVPVSYINITGNPVVGATLTATLDETEATGAYQWMSGDTEVGTNSNKYLIKEGDVGKTITVKFAASGNYTGTPISTATAEIVKIFNITQNKGYDDIETTLDEANEEGGDTVLVGGTIGSADRGTGYTVYTINKPVIIQGTEGSKVYGTFMVKVDNVTIDNLAIENKGDLTSESSNNRGGIYVFANNVTLTNNTITNGLGENAGLSNAIQIMSPTANNSLSSYKITDNKLIGHDNEVPNWSSSGIVIAQGYKPGSAGAYVEAITATEADYTSLLSGNTFTNNKIDLTHQDWSLKAPKNEEKVIYPYAIVQDKEELERALTHNTKIKIIVNGTLGSEEVYNVYNVDRTVIIQGTEGSKVYGTFMVKADNVTIDNLAIQNKGDLKDESSNNRGGIYVFANNVTLTNNTITNGLGENAGLSNAIQIMSPTANNSLSSYKITDNKLIGHDNEVPNWSSSGIVIAQGYKPGSAGAYVEAITATEADYTSLLSGNTFTNNKIDVQHQDWTANPVVLYPYALTGLTISGDAKVGEILTSTVSPDGATVNYQWQVFKDGAWTAIKDAKSSTYTVADEYAGCKL